jgi:hypothetical protein
MTPVDAIRFLPFPEIVEEATGQKPYTILDSMSVAGLPSTGMVSKKMRLMFVPLRADGASTIRHELAHVRWSPARLPRTWYNGNILLAVEDARINLALRRIDLPVETETEWLRRVVILANQDLERKDTLTFILRSIASLGTNALPNVLDAFQFGPKDMEDLTREILREVELRLESSRQRAGDHVIARFETAKKTADHVANMLARRGFDVSRQKSRSGFAETGCCLSCEHPPSGVMSRIMRSAELAGSHGMEDISAAEMFIAEPPLPVACARGRRGGMGRKARRTGTLIRTTSRWFSDKAIFRGAARTPGGTVLVDTSSSMKLDAAGVDRILRHAPGATLIAMYSGKAGKGELRIVARLGRRVANDGLVPYGEGNLIDLPALKWLAAQPGPRIWLSDGRVTGERDWASGVIARQCYLVCRRHGIRRVETAEEAGALLEGRTMRVHPIIP